MGWGNCIDWFPFCKLMYEIAVYSDCLFMIVQGCLGNPSMLLNIRFILSGRFLSVVLCIKPKRLSSEVSLSNGTARGEYSH